jgi:hypothetical protein
VGKGSPPKHGRVPTFCMARFPGSGGVTRREIVGDWGLILGDLGDLGYGYVGIYLVVKCAEGTPRKRRRRNFCSYTPIEFVFAPIIACLGASSAIIPPLTPMVCDSGHQWRFGSGFFCFLSVCLEWNLEKFGVFRGFVPKCWLLEHGRLVGDLGLDRGDWGDWVPILGKWEMTPSPVTPRFYLVHHTCDI